ncbi:MAG: hypothetical protein JF614_12145 [Acidobacteria bacterium]|nr:hypothetical protein [Acidobacteriota bacterium]
MNRQVIFCLLLLISLGFVGALAGGCQSRAREPRQLAFPTFQAAAPFPEFQSAAAIPERAEGSAPSQFTRALNEQPSAATPAAPESQSVPLGSSMTAQIPPREKDWTWSLADGATLIAHAPNGGRPGALVYVEPFSADIHNHPSTEHLRFQMTVDPELAENYLRLTAADVVLAGRAAAMPPLSRSEAARWAQLLKTRTQGRGLGFRPTRSSFTGWRWVGRNGHEVTVRCSRYLGVWAQPRPWPAPVAAALARLRGEPEKPVSPPGAPAPPFAPAAVPAVAGVSSYLILGSATDRDEETGVHFAILCVREPRCLVYKELTQFLESIQIAEGPQLDRLRSAPPVPFQKLVQETGLEILSGSELPDLSKRNGKPGTGTAPEQVPR